MANFVFIQSKPLKNFCRLTVNLFWILKLSFRASGLRFCVRIVATILFVFFPIFSAWILRSILNNILSGDVFGNIILLIFLKIFFDLGTYFLDSLLEGIFKIMRFDLERYFVRTVLNKLNSLDLAFFENSSFLDLKQKVTDSYVDRPTEFLNVAFWSLYNLLQVFVQGAIILHANFLWLVSLLLFQLPALIILVRIGQSAWNIWSADTLTRRKFAYFSGLFSNLAYIKEFKLYNLGHFFIDRVMTLIGKFHQSQEQIERKRIIKGFLAILLSSLPIFYISYGLLYSLARKLLSVGDFTFYTTSLAVFYLALQNLVKNINYGYENNLYIKDIRKFLQLSSRIEINMEEKLLKKRINVQVPSIKFDKISFSYPGSRRQVFSNFSLSIKPGQKLALVGENGSGKTTLVKLLCRYYDVDKGKIMLSGIDIKEIPLQVLRSYFSVLFQDFVGYDMTVKENIVPGYDQKIYRRRIIKSAKMAGAHSFILALPERYDQLLGTAFTNGEQLSAGQWQRIALAKVFMRESPVIILDEPTAAVDAKAEHDIFRRVMKLIERKTVLMISHRFSSVRTADKIIVLDNGKIKEGGTHKELMAANGKYAYLFNLQAEGYK